MGSVLCFQLSLQGADTPLLFFDNTLQGRSAWNVGDDLWFVERLAIASIQCTCSVCTDTSFWLNSFCSLDLDASNSCRLDIAT